MARKLWILRHIGDRKSVRGCRELGIRKAVGLLALRSIRWRAICEATKDPSPSERWAIVLLMGESERITLAEREVKGALDGVEEPMTSAELRDRIDSATPMSLLRLAVQRLIGQGVILYDADRRYSLASAK